MKLNTDKEIFSHMCTKNTAELQIYKDLVDFKTGEFGDSPFVDMCLDSQPVMDYILGKRVDIYKKFETTMRPYFSMKASELIKLLPNITNEDLLEKKDQERVKELVKEGKLNLSNKEAGELYVEFTTGVLYVASKVLKDLPLDVLPTLGMSLRLTRFVDPDVKEFILDYVITRIGKQS